MRYRSRRTVQFGRVKSCYGVFFNASVVSHCVYRIWRIYYVGHESAKLHGKRRRCTLENPFTNTDRGPQASRFRGRITELEKSTTTFRDVIFLQNDLLKKIKSDSGEDRVFIPCRRPFRPIRRTDIVRTTTRRKQTGKLLSKGVHKSPRFASAQSDKSNNSGRKNG